MKRCKHENGYFRRELQEWSTTAFTNSEPNHSCDAGGNPRFTGKIIVYCTDCFKEFVCNENNIPKWVEVLSDKECNKPWFRE